MCQEDLRKLDLEDVGGGGVLPYPHLAGGVVELLLLRESRSPLFFPQQIQTVSCQNTREGVVLLMDAGIATHLHFTRGKSTGSNRTFRNASWHPVFQTEPYEQQSRTAIRPLSSWRPSARTERRECAEWAAVKLGRNRQPCLEDRNFEILHLTQNLPKRCSLVIGQSSQEAMNHGSDW